MFPTFPNMTALVFFGTPIIALIYAAKPDLAAGTIARRIAFALSLIAAVLGALGRIPAVHSYRGTQEWTGLFLCLTGQEIFPAAAESAADALNAGPSSRHDATWAIKLGCVNMANTGAAR